MEKKGCSALREQGQNMRRFRVEVESGSEREGDDEEVERGQVLCVPSCA